MVELVGGGYVINKAYPCIVYEPIMQYKIISDLEHNQGKYSVKFQLTI